MKYKIEAFVTRTIDNKRIRITGRNTEVEFSETKDYYEFIFPDHAGSGIILTITKENKEIGSFCMVCGTNINHMPDSCPKCGIILKQEDKIE